MKHLLVLLTLLMATMHIYASNDNTSDAPATIEQDFDIDQDFEVDDQDMDQDQMQVQYQAQEQIQSNIEERRQAREGDEDPNYIQDQVQIQQ